MDLTVDIMGAAHWSYSYAGTNRSVVSLIEVKPGGSLPENDVQIFPRVTLRFPFKVAEVWEGQTRSIESSGLHTGTQKSWDRINLDVDYSVLGSIREHVPGKVQVEIVNASTGEVLAKESRDLTLLAANSFRFEQEYFDALAAFVLPSDSYVAEILVKAQQILERETGSGSLEGYQAEIPFSFDPRPLEDRSRAYKIARAIYRVLADEPYVYSDPPGNFFATTQRVRTPSQIKSDNSGTCLDTTVLMAACLAQAGLEPLLFLVVGHAFVGYITGESLPDGRYGQDAVDGLKQTFGTSLNKVDHKKLLQFCLSNKLIMPIETTTTGRGSNTPFHEACQKQNVYSAEDDSKLRSIVVVSNAWREGITPPVSLAEVPLRGFVHVPGKVSDLDEPVAVARDFEFSITLDLEDPSMSAEEKARPPRVRQWMSSLLDLGSRNPLLKVKSHILEFPVAPSLLGKIDDLLYTPRKKIEIISPLGLPREWMHEGATDGKYDTWIKANLKLVYPSHKELNPIQRDMEAHLKLYRGATGDFIPDTFKKAERDRIEQIRSDRTHEYHKTSDAILLTRLVSGKLDSLHSVLAKKLKAIESKATETMLMTGNNSLYLALGSVSWTEQANARGNNKTTEWCAPLYLYPVILEGGKGSPFTIRLDPNGEATPNYPLHEKLKREPYNLDIQELINPAMDDSGIDFDLMIQTVSQRLSQAHLNNFAVQPRVFLGVFDYSTFRLWNDFKQSWKKMTEISSVARHLILTPNQDFGGLPTLVERQLEPYMPIAADDSQRQAVQWALDGKSFRLEGPPGTGKSQTITNLLASCIAHNKKVLFIAEKQTALNAVMERLEDAGLGKYCLNLHAKGDSDTRMRKKIAESLTTALAERVDPQDAQWTELSHRMRTEEAALDRYRTGLHEIRVGGMSTWEANEQIIDLGSGSLLNLPDSFIENFEVQWPALLEACSHIDAAMDMVGDPRLHIWRMVVGNQVPSAGNQQVTTTIKKLLELVSDGTNSTHVNSLIDDFGLEALVQVADGLRVARNHGIVSSAMLEQVLPESNALGAVGREIDEFIDQCLTVVENIKTTAGVVSPDFLVHSRFDEIKSLLFRIDNASEDQDVLAVLDAWLLLSRNFEALGGGFSDEIFDVENSERAIRAMATFDQLVSSQNIDDLVVSMTKLSLAVERHGANIRSSFLGRNDHMKIALLLKDAGEAGALTKGRKFRALRDELGGDALTEDARLLSDSVKDLLALVKDVDDIRLILQTKYSPDLVTDLKPWDSADIFNFAAMVQKQQVNELRSVAQVGGETLDDAQYVVSLRKLLNLVPQVEECRQILALRLPNLASTTSRPWKLAEKEWLLELVKASLSAEIRLLAGSSILTADSMDALEGLRTWITQRDQIMKLQNVDFPYLFPQYSSSFAVWNIADVQALVDARIDLATVFAKIDNPALVNKLKLLIDGDAGSLGTSLTEFAQAWSDFCNNFVVNDKSMSRWLGNRSLNTAIAEDFPRLVTDAGDRNRYLELERWTDLLVAMDRLDSVGLGGQKDLLLSGDIDISMFASDARRSALHSAFDKLSAEAGLDKFDRKRHEQRIINFEKALKDAQETLRVRIPGLVFQRRSAKVLPTAANVGATSALLKGLKPGRGDKTPIRDLISKYGNSLSDAMPCFLMSPDSVATLVPVGAIDFDVVVFDEASQIRTSHAVGALGRGKAGIVVGDRKQMPPSNTFSSNIGTFVDVDEFDSEDSVLEDLSDELSDLLVQPEAAQDSESILTEFYSCNFPSMQLLCHYRSRDEVLISFSNTNIYDEPMLTFPSTKGFDSDALRYIHIPDGYFQRSKNAPKHEFKNTGASVSALRTNLPEAEALVDYVLTYLRDPTRNARLKLDKSGKCESIIVVTFNQQQRELVEEMLRDKDPVLFDIVTRETPGDEEAGTKPLPPRLKIRNLENVQGDEAETIIFSVAFTKDKDAKNFSLNWGPVTQAGGERRLNVAVTRAQKEMIVFASFLPGEMIGAGRKVSPEAQMVYRFLQLAHSGANQVGGVGISVPRSSYIEGIATELRLRGYETFTQLGLSSLRVDIAVRKPGSSQWQLAIMVDDSCWAERGSAFQREILPRQVLPGLGWEKVMRIWFPSWMDDRAGLLQDIDDFFDGISEPEPEPEPEPMIENAGQPSIAHVEDTPTTYPPPPHSDDSPVLNLRHYPFQLFEATVVGDVSILERAGQIEGSRAELLKILNSILIVEGPIEATRLAKLFYRCLDFTRVSPERVRQVLSHLDPNQITTDVLGTFVWHPAQNESSWQHYRTSMDGAMRSSSEISAVEYFNALEDLVSNDPPVAYEAAVRAVAETFGFKKLTKVTRASIDTVFEEAIRNGRVNRIGDDLYPGLLAVDM